MAHDPFWNSHQAREATMRHRPGALVRLGRHHRGWTLAVLGEQLGCSVATVSRLERAARVGDLALVRRAAQVVGVPSFLLATSLGLAAVSPAVATTVAAGPRAAEEDPMRRRTLLATATAGPAAALLAVDDALAVPPQPTGHAEPVDQALARARALYDHGSYRPLLTGLPNLLGNAHHAARTRRDLDHARLSAAYALAAAVLVKVGRYGPARLAADRATTYAHVSESALAGAAAARELAIVLRHQDRGEAARQLMARATADVEATGLRTEAQAAAYAQMLATSAYTAARSGDRTSALAMADEARRAARSLPRPRPQDGCSPSPRPPSTCMPSASTGPSATPAPPWKPARTCTPDSSPPPNAAPACTPTSPAPGGSGTAPPMPPASSWPPPASAPARSTTARPSAPSPRT